MLFSDWLGERKQSLLILGSSLCFVLNQLLPYKQEHLFLSSYFDDLCCMPIVLGLAQWLMRKWLGPNFALSGTMCVVATVLIAIYAEGIFPLIDSRFTADLLDVVFYAIGATAFWVLGKQRAGAIELAISRSFRN